MRLCLIFCLIVACGGKPDGNTPTDTKADGRVLEGPFTGLRVAGALDLTGDSASDVVISAPDLDGSGAVWVMDAGKTGSLGAGDEAAVIEGQREEDIGEGLDACDDLNGDGVGDLAIGLPRGNSGRGGVWLLNGPLSGTISTGDAYIIRGTKEGGDTGHSVVCDGDFDNDGKSDLLFSAPLTDGFGIATVTGEVYFHKSLDVGTDAIANFSTTFTDSKLGFDRSLSIAADLNGDGLSDAVMGAHGVSRIHILFAPFMGTYDGNATGIRFDGREDDDQFGHSAAVGDLDNDGYPDVVAGAPYYEAQFGAVGVLSGPFDDNDGGLVSAEGHWINGQDQLEYTGFSVAIADDLNGDGRADLIIGAPGAITSGEGAGVAYILYGPAAGGSVTDADLVLVGTSPFANFGHSVEAVPDVTGDGLDEIIVGAPFADVDKRTGAGAAYLFHSPYPARVEDAAATANYIF